MGLKILKYQLSNDVEQIVSMPSMATVLSAQMQHGALCVWALVDTDNDPSPRTFRIFGTGNPATHAANMLHVGSVQERGFVWHVFTNREK